MFLLTAFFGLLSLRVTVMRDGLDICMKPFPMGMMVPDKVKWSDIRSITVSDALISEYGRWGVHISCNGESVALNGKYGLQLDYTNGRRLFVGTSDPEGLSKALVQAGISISPGD
jgi:hypothetical protein